MIGKLFKTIFVIFILSIILVISYAGFYYYKDKEREKAELTYLTNIEWKWHNKINRIQIGYSKKTNSHLLRKVHLNEKYVISARIYDDYRMGTIVKFSTKCKPKSKISTSKTFSNGTPKTLYCDDGGKSLIHGVMWQNSNEAENWKGDLDGFKFSENFIYWDFAKLIQEVTLSKAE